MRVGRNEPCPCGSGRKSKQCCGGRASRKFPVGLAILLAAMGLLAAAGAISAFVGRDDKPAAASRAAAPRNGVPGSPQPGPAPAGKVWSVEHGHWHDAAPRRATGGPAQNPIRIEATPGPSSARTTAPIKVNRPQPGPAPEGKVWSPEHGHWHDVRPAAR